MANYSHSEVETAEDDLLEDDLDLGFDEDDGFMERSQRRMLKAQRHRVSRRHSDWD